MKVKAVTDFPKPTTQKDVKCFLGLVSYYRKFISEFTTKVKPLTNLLKKNVDLLWTQIEQDSFEILKQT